MSPTSDPLDSSGPTTTSLDLGPFSDVTDLVDNVTSYGGEEVINRMFRSTLDAVEDEFVAVYLIVLFILAGVLNVLVLRVAYYKRRVLKPAEWFIVCLAAIDLLGVACFIMPIVSSLRHQWSFGETGCRVYAFMEFFVGLFSMNILAAMSVVRAVKTIHPNVGNRLNKFWTRAILVAVFVYSVVWAILPLLGFGKYGPEPSRIACSIDWSSGAAIDNTYVTTILVVCLGLPCLCMSVSYGMVMCVVRRIKNSASASHQSRERMKRVTKLVFVMCLIFLVCWLPYSIVCMWAAYGNPEDIPLGLSASPPLMAKLSTMINPLIYFFVNARFRAATKEYLKLPCRRNSPKVIPSIQKNEGIAGMEMEDMHRHKRLDLKAPPVARSDTHTAIAIISRPRLVIREMEPRGPLLSE